MGEHVGHLSQLRVLYGTTIKGVANIATYCVFCAGSKIDCCFRVIFSFNKILPVLGREKTNINIQYFNALLVYFVRGGWL